jgi:hypothetical protein
MKNVALGICIFLFLLSPLSAQETFYLEAYNDLQSDINMFAGREIEAINYEMKLIFYSCSDRGKALIGDMRTKTLSPLPVERIGQDYTHVSGHYFWDSHTKEIYAYCRGVPIDWNSGEGWYQLVFSNNFLTFRLQSYSDRWAQYSPSHVQLSSNRIFSARYESYLYSYREYQPCMSYFSITDTDTNKTIWEYSTGDRYSFTDFYWVTGQWYLTQVGYFALRGIWQDTISNYETGETVSFAPECIIGYGDGVILTSVMTNGAFTGITVWTPEKEILYRDRSFSLTETVHNERMETPGIYISYFDFPYIYCNIGKGLELNLPYATLIMNLMDGKTYHTPRTYHLLGILE